MNILLNSLLSIKMEKEHYNGKDADIKKALKLKEQRELETFNISLALQNLNTWR